MRPIRLSRAARATLGTVAGGLSLACGAALEWGAGVGLIAGGVLAGLFFTFLYETDEERRR